MGREEHTVTVVWGQWEISEGSAIGLTFTIPNLLLVCWWDSQLLLGNDLPAGDPEPFHKHLPRAPCPFLTGTWPPRACLALQESATTHSVFESRLRADSEAEQSCFKSTLAKNYFPDTLLPWLC